MFKYTYYSAGGSLSESCLLLDACDIVGDRLEFSIGISSGSVFVMIERCVLLSLLIGSDLAKMGRSSGNVCRTFSSVNWFSVLTCKDNTSNKS